MRIIAANGVFYANAPADDPALAAAGWRWIKSRNQWMTGAVPRVQPFRAFCDAEAGTQVDRWVKGRETAIAASVAVSSEIVLPSPAGLEYRPYQKAGTAFMLSRHTSLNADVPRLGKTIQSLGVINNYDRPLKTLVVCPAIAKTNWCREAEKWLVHKPEIAYCEGAKFNPQTPFLVINYDILGRHIEWLDEQDWDVIVFDEAHYLKNKGSGRSRLAYPLKAKLHRLFLTGTPVYTRPKDIFPLCEAADPTRLGRNWFTFMRRYCGAFKDGNGRWDYDGSSNEEELQFKLRSSFMIRREKNDVVAEIPPNRQTLHLPKAGLEVMIKREESAVRKNLAKLLQLLDAEDADGIEKLAEHDGRGSNEVDETGPVATVRRELALAKVPMVVNYVTELLQSEEKLVVWGHHRGVVQSIAKAFGNAATHIIGGMTSKQRDAAVTRFKEDPTCRLIVGNVISMGTAISLANADTAVFAELSWVPSEIDQAEERIWDVLKTRPCSIVRLVLEDSLEAKIARVMEKRQHAIDRMTKAKYLEGKTFSLS